MIMQSAQEMIESMLELAGGSFDGLMKGLRLICHCHGLVTFKTRFHHAALVVFPAFLTVLIAEVDFDAANMFREVAKRVFHHVFGMLDQRFAPVDRVVSIDLDLQNVLLLFGKGTLVSCCALTFL
jgi:hypothetical protein